MVWLQLQTAGRVIQSQQQVTQRTPGKGSVVQSQGHHFRGLPTDARIQPEAGWLRSQHVSRWAHCAGQCRGTCRR